MTVLRFIVLLLAGVVTLAAAEREFVRVFPVGEAPSVELETYRGGIIVTESDRAEVRVLARVEIGGTTDTEVEALMQGFDFEANDSSGTVRVRLRHPGQSGARFVWNEERQVLPTVRVAVPARCDLRLKTTEGAVTVGNITGRLQIESDSGDIFLRTVGGSVEVRSETAQVVVSRCLGSLRVDVQHGLIQVGTVTGPCQLRNHSGEIEIQTPKGELKVLAEAGGVTVGVPADFVGPADVRTSGGLIVAQLDPVASVRLEASASIFAKVRSRVPLTVEAGAVDTRKLTGTLNGGRAKLVLRASGGDVRILPRPPGFE